MGHSSPHLTLLSSPIGASFARFRRQDMCLVIVTHDDYKLYMQNMREAIEVFHLLFLKQLGSRVDKNLWVLKGGCNLRFFLKSVRYSEDMDIDVHTMAPTTLRRNVNTILNSTSFASILKSFQLATVQYSEPKQTGTTQRWKIRLRMPVSDQEVPTKIEFSRRGVDKGIVFEPVDGELLHRYRLSPMLATHYTKETAFLQKVTALAKRGETQARDIFDLKLLIDAGATPADLQPTQKPLFTAACQRALALRHTDFNSQVVAYLPPEWQDYYSDRLAWDDLQKMVSETLHRLTK